MIQHILFDFDGTLVDTNDIIILALQQTVKTILGREASTEDLHAVLGKYLDAQMKYFSETHATEMVEFYRQFYRNHQDDMVKKFDGIDEMLISLKQSGCKLGITSAKGRGGILHGLELFNFAPYIDLIVSAYDVENQKPHPESVYKAMEYFQCTKDDIMLIGDSPYDIQCGINAGIKTALVSWTIFPQERFNNIKPDYIIKTPHEIVKIATAAK